MPDNRLLTIAPCIALIECGENFVPCFWREYKLSRWKFITKIDGATGLMHTARAFNTLEHTRHDWDNAVFICECNEFAHNHLKYCGHSCKFFTQSLVLIMHHCADFFSCICSRIPASAFCLRSSISSSLIPSRGYMPNPALVITIER